MARVAEQEAALEIGERGERDARPLALLRGDLGGRRGFGGERGGQHVGRLQPGEQLLRARGEGGADVGVEVSPGAARDGMARCLRATVVVRHHGLLGDVHDPRRERQLVAGPPGGKAKAVVTLVDLIERRDRPRRQTQPGAERGADLATPLAEFAPLSRNLLGEARAQPLGALSPRPAGEPSPLGGHFVRIGQLQGLQLALDRDVIVEQVRERGGVSRASERAQQGGEVHGAALGRL